MHWTTRCSGCCLKAVLICTRYVDGLNSSVGLVLLLYNPYICDKIYRWLTVVFYQLWQDDFQRIVNLVDMAVWNDLSRINEIIIMIIWGLGIFVNKWAQICWTYSMAMSINWCRFEIHVVLKYMSIFHAWRDIKKSVVKIYTKTFYWEVSSNIFMLPIR